jgi:hypothetical protein
MTVMKYAIISDIHGNLPALNTAIEDAWKIGVENYIFVAVCLATSNLLKFSNKE